MNAVILVVQFSSLSAYLSVVFYYTTMCATSYICGTCFNHFVQAPKVLFAKFVFCI